MAKREKKDGREEVRGWRPPELKGKVAVVTGASRGAARGIALALGDAGATVYVVARTMRSGPKPKDGAAGTVEDTAEEVTRRGGVGIAVAGDMTVEAEAAAVFERVQREQGRLDLLANGILGVTDNLMEMGGRKIWELPENIWRQTVQGTAGPSFVTSYYAAKRMVEQKSGVIVHVSEPTGTKFSGKSVVWDLWVMSHAVMNGLVVAMAHELKKHNVAAIGMWPGFMRTERVMMHIEKNPKVAKMFRLDLSESTEYVGRAVAMLAADKKVMAKSGKMVNSGDMAKEYGFKDVDGKYVENFYKAMKMKFE